jgi:hypothetical protein
VTLQESQELQLSRGTRGSFSIPLGGGIQMQDIQADIAFEDDIQFIEASHDLLAAAYYKNIQ